MSFINITNNPWEKHSLTYPWVYWDNAFTEDELELMSKYFSMNGVERGTTVGNVEITPEGKEIIKQKPDDNVRKSNVMFYARTPETAWIFDKFNFVSQQINDLFYGFDLYGYDTMQYTEYESNEGGKYDFHMDMIMGPNLPPDMHKIGTRKLSLVMLLTEPGVDFEGGEFQINNGQEKVAEILPTKKGRIIAFPSWMIHRVAPTTKGKRKSLVIWLMGPKFK